MNPRTIALLSLIPSAPRAIGARALADRLLAAGFPVTKRTVERDLVAFTKILPIVARTETTPYGWSWAKGASCFCCGNRHDDVWIATARNWRERYVIAARECELLRDASRPRLRSCGGESR